MWIVGQSRTLFRGVQFLLPLRYTKRPFSAQSTTTTVTFVRWQLFGVAHNQVGRAIPCAAEKAAPTEWPPYLHPVTAALLIFA
jgi:hypothetical protein